jgi:hypothetical protein
MDAERVHQEEGREFYRLWGALVEEGRSRLAQWMRGEES